MIIYAIIVTYNAMRNSWIKRCLKSLAESTTPVIPIVIDNGSTDNTCLFVPKEYPEVIWFPQNKNLGFGQANNVGIKYALDHDADYILLLNQDAILAANAVEEMLPYADNNSLVSPLHLSGDGNKLDYQFKKCLSKSDDSLLDDLLVAKKQKAYYSGPTRESGCIIPAACWFMSIGVIKTIGGFNPLFFHYSEDDNYIQRLFYHHIEVKICPKATMRHDRGEHGNVEVFYRSHCHRMLLKIAVDINLSFTQCMVRWLRLLKDCYATNLPQHHYHIGEYLKGVLWLIKNTRKILLSRKKEKKPGTTWISATPHTLHTPV